MGAQVNPETDKRRWELLREFYAASEGAKVNFAPMIELLKWVSAQPFAAEIYGNTSLDALCISRKPGYHPKDPFFSCDMRLDGLMHFTLWDKVGSQRQATRVPPDWANETFAEFVRLLSAGR